jgi:hypothetical protein
MLMKMLMMVAGFVFLMGCASNPDAKSVLETLEFGEDEIGCFRFTGMVDVGGNPFTSSNVNISLVKQKGDNAPDC